MFKYILQMFAGMGIAAYMVFILCLIIFGPFITIWSLNTLFGLGIGYTFKTWLATFCLTMVFGASSTQSQK